MWLDYRYGSAINYDSDRFHTVPRLPGDGIYAIDLGMVLICATDPPPRRFFCFQAISLTKKPLVFPPSHPAC